VFSSVSSVRCLGLRFPGLKMVRSYINPLPIASGGLCAGRRPQLPLIDHAPITAIIANAMFREAAAPNAYCLRLAKRELQPAGPGAGRPTAGNAEIFLARFSASSRSARIGLWLRRQSSMPPHAWKAYARCLSRKAPVIVSKLSLRSYGLPLYGMTPKRAGGIGRRLPLDVPKKLDLDKRRGGRERLVPFSGRRRPCPGGWWSPDPAATGGCSPTTGPPVITEASGGMEHLMTPTDAENG